MIVIVLSIIVLVLFWTISIKPTEKISHSPDTCVVSSLIAGVEKPTDDLPSKVFIKSTNEWIDLPPQKICKIQHINTEEEEIAAANKWLETRTPEQQAIIKTLQRENNAMFLANRLKRYIKFANDRVRDGRSYAEYSQLIIAEKKAQKVWY